MPSSLGKWLGIALSLLAAEARAAPSSADPSDQALFFMPTAFLPPAGAFSFRDFELLFLTFGYSPGERTALSVGFLFPVLPGLQVGTIGLKRNLWSDGSRAALSITGSLTKPLGDGPPDDVGIFANSNLIASKRFEGSDGEEYFGMHGAIGYLGHRERYGFRLHGERLAADIAGLRPFTGTGVGKIILWPLLVVSYRI
ncbi:MAG: hypothetical protein JF616_22385 [Fibrobacteres bacterium]|jgi:hypothetical protein|nr:hypothetical protein [Fibrobacterota bacterium]